MKTIEFEADVRESRIQVPEKENLEACHVRVILMWDQEHTEEAGAQSSLLSTPTLRTKGYRFNRQDANARE